MKTIYAGPEGTCQPGKTIVLEKEEAQALVKGGYAENAPAEKQTKPEPRETAVVEPPENTSEIPSSQSAPKSGDRNNPKQQSGRRG